MILDDYNYKLYVKDKVIELTSSEVKVLQILIKYKKQVITLKDFKINYFYNLSNFAIRQIIYRLNKKLQPYARINSKNNIGYYLQIKK